MTTPSRDEMLYKIHYQIKPTCFENILSRPSSPIEHLMIWDVIDWAYNLIYWDKKISYDERDKLIIQLVNKWSYYRKSIYAQSDSCVAFIFRLLP